MFISGLLVIFNYTSLCSVVPICHCAVSCRYVTLQCRADMSLCSVVPICHCAVSCRYVTVQCRADVTVQCRADMLLCSVVPIRHCAVSCRYVTVWSSFTFNFLAISLAQLHYSVPSGCTLNTALSLPLYLPLKSQVRQCTYNGTTKRVRVTIVAVEKHSLLHIVSVCL